MNVNLINKSSLIKIVIFVILFISILTLINIPLFRSINDIYNKLFTENSGFTAEYKLGHSLKQSSIDYNNYNKIIPAYNDLISKESNELSLITDLENLAKKHNLNQTLTLRSNKKVLNSEILTLGLSIDLSGNYNNLLNYLYDLEQINLKIAVNSIDLNKLNNDDIISISLLTNTYWLK